VADEPAVSPPPKVQPKLRMIANATAEVTAARAEHSCAVQVAPDEIGTSDLVRGQEAVPRDPRKEIPEDEEEEWGELPEAAPARVSVFVQLADDLEHEALPAELGAAKTPGDEDVARDDPLVTARKGTLLTVELPADRAVELGERDWALNVELGQPLAPPHPDTSPDAVDEPDPATVRKVALPEDVPRRDVLIGIVDVGGFDFAHPDFLDEQGNTRWVAIWDQGGNMHPPPSFGYGSVIEKDHLDAAIDAANAGGLPAHLLEPQSQMEEESHATHVASIAAGNHGVCRDAHIAGVLISIPEDETARRFSFYDSSRVAHAVEWLLELGRERDMPVSINISLGTNGHAHDDSSAVSRWIDAALTLPGRSVCVAAGNAGQEKAEHEGDIGYILGRVHAGGHIKARSLVADLEWNVVGNGIADLSENELEVWYGPQDRFAVQVKPPDGAWTEEIEPGQFIENRQLPDRTFISIYNELYTAANGLNYIAIYLSPRLRRPIVGVPGGQWLVRLIGRDVRNGKFHAWIERDDPRRVGRIGRRQAWVFPSFFSENSMVDESTVTSLACGQRIVSVANLDEERRRINPTSSQGPTRDARQKPDLAAPGTNIVAAKGFAADGQWVKMSGTSMASPYVAGVAALMLSVNPRLTGAQIGGILQRTAEPLPGADFTWRNDYGSGLISPAECVSEAHTMRARVDRT
jgi:subtilisin family serine protease